MKGMALLCVLFLLWGCGDEREDGGALVRIGEVEIDAERLRDYREKLPSSLQSGLDGEAAVRDLLQSLIDRQIMLLEAKVKGFDREPAVQKRLEIALNKALTDSLVKQEVAPRVRVTEEEIYEIYQRDHWDQEHWPAHILSGTEEEAWEVVRALKQGANFSELARKRSIAPDAEQGGDLRSFFGPGDAATPIVDVVVGLPPGEFTDPIKTRDGYEVIKVLDVRAIPFAQVKEGLGQGLYREKSAVAHFQFLESLETKHGVVYHPEGVGSLLRVAKAGDSLSAEEEQLPLVSYGEGMRISTGQGARMLIDGGKLLEAIDDSLEAIRSLRARIMADTLLLMEVRAQGLDETPIFRELADTRLKRLMVDYLYKTEILDRVEATEEEIRQEYENKKDQYDIPEESEVVELLVRNEEQARELAAQIRAGGDLVTLARQHTLRPGMRGTGGIFSVQQRDKELGMRFLEQVKNAAVGELVGPVAVEGGFSIFKVEKRQPESMLPLEHVRNVLEFYVKKQNAEKAFNGYIEKLREQYADRIQWNDRRIEELAASGEW